MIKEKLYEVFKYLTDRGYNKNNIVAIYWDGHNYTVIVVPSFKEVCLDVPIETIFKFQFPIHLIDIRILNRMEHIDFLNKNACLLLAYSDLFKKYFIETKNIQEGLIEIFKKNFAGVFGESFCTKDFFLKQLTHTEEKAYQAIIKEIGAEGNISTTKLIEKYTISRPVFTSLFNKLKENNVADVINQGKKGIYIRIIHPQLKMEAIEK